MRLLAVLAWLSAVSGCARTLRLASDGSTSSEAGADAAQDRTRRDLSAEAVRTDRTLDTLARLEVAADRGSHPDARTSDTRPSDAAKDLSASDGQPNAAPTATITFPLPVAMTTAATLPVRGTASDPDGVVGVSVNGVPASSNDGFATWSAVVPISAGLTNLSVAVHDAKGKLQSTAATAAVQRVGAVLMRTVDVAVASSGTKALLLDTWGTAVVEANLSTSALTTRSDPGTGSGPALGVSFSLAWDGAGPTAYVAAVGGVLSVDLTTGNRAVISSGVTSVIRLQPSKNRAIVVAANAIQAVALTGGARTTISSSTVGSGPALASPGAIAIDDAADRAIVVDGSLKAIFEVKLASGQRAILSGGGVGTGVALASPTGLALDAASQVAYVVDGPNLVAVQLATGSRAVVSNSASGGPPFAIPQGAAMHPDGRVLVMNAWPAQLLGVTPATGARTILAATALGSGPSLWVANAVAADPGLMRALVLEPGAGASHSVDLNNGNRERLFKSGSTGANIYAPGGGAFDLTGGRALVTDSAEKGLFAVSLATSNRTPVSTPAVGTGAALVSPAGVELDLPGGRALLVDRGLQALLALELATGNRTILSGGTVGSGPAFADPADLSLDLVTGQAYVADRTLSGNAGAVVRVALAGGSRALLAGTGPAITTVKSVAFQPQSKKLLVLASVAGSPSLLTMDPVSGDHVVISGSSVGLGPRFIIPTDVVSFPGRVSLVVDEWANAIFAVDELSGDRVIVSH